MVENSCSSSAAVRKGLDERQVFIWIGESNGCTGVVGVLITVGRIAGVVKGNIVGVG